MVDNDPCLGEIDAICSFFSSAVCDGDKDVACNVCTVQSMQHLYSPCAVYTTHSLFILSIMPAHAHGLT